MYDVFHLDLIDVSVNRSPLRKVSQITTELFIRNNSPASLEEVKKMFIRHFLNHQIILLIS